MIIANVPLPDEEPKSTPEPEIHQAEESFSNERFSTKIDHYEVESIFAARYEDVSRAEHTEYFRTRLGASVIGSNCDRALWYGFRHAVAHKPSGRLARLFERGHQEEPRVIARLRKMGLSVYDRDNNGEQYAYSAHAGHFGCKVDGVVVFEDSGWPQELIGSAALLSIKTASTGKPFTKYSDDPMEIANARYWAQECVAGQGLKVERVVYAIVCKNDDAITFRVHDLDLEHGRKMESKALTIILAKEAPAGISKTATLAECKACDYKGVCVGARKPDKNCRSCTHAEPSPNGNHAWFCRPNNGIIPDNIIKTGCDNWEPIK